MEKIVVEGAGTFGTAISERLSWNKENEIFIHTRNKETMYDINNNKKNSKYFPSKFVSNRLTATIDTSVFGDADVIFLAIPSSSIISFSYEIKEITKKNPLVINLAKGLSDSGAFITEDIPFKRKASMKGPSFAIETINGLPTSFTFAGEKDDYEYFRKKIINNTGFTLDYTDDIKSVELCSVLKNMYAIAIGIVSGKYDSPNVDFLVYSKAVREMRALLSLYSCDPDSIFCYCGLGDLGLTALNDLSRNRTLGMLIGKGFNFDEEKNTQTVLEGLRTVGIVSKRIIERKREDDFPLVMGLKKLLKDGGDLNSFLLLALK